MMIELLGNFPRSVTTTGKFCGDYFNRKGELKHIHRCVNVIIAFFICFRVLFRIHFVEKGLDFCVRLVREFF